MSSDSPTPARFGTLADAMSGHLCRTLAKSGQEKWNFSTDGGVGSSPAISDGAVYFGSFDGYLYAVE